MFISIVIKHIAAYDTGIDSCPLPDPLTNVGFCLMECESDADCTDSLKCCPTACGGGQCTVPKKCKILPTIKKTMVLCYMIHIIIYAYVTLVDHNILADLGNQKGNNLFCFFQSVENTWIMICSEQYHISIEENAHLLHC